MRILVVKLSPIESNDSANIRTLGIVKGLFELNHSIDYLTIPTSNKTNKTNIENRFLNEINIIRTINNATYDTVTSEGGTSKKVIVKLLRKIYHLFSVYDYTYSIAKKVDIKILNNKEYDLVISSSDPKTSHIAVQNLIKQGLKYKKWIQYWGDPLAIDITNKSIYPEKILSIIEKKIISSTDKIVYVSPFTLEKQKKIFPELTDFMTFLPIPYIREKYYKDANNKNFTIGYFGAYYSNIRNIQPLYNVCYSMEDICLKIVGDSDLMLQPTDNITILPRGDISELEKKTDLLVCILNTKGTQIPGKIYHSAATNRPVLIIVDGDNREKMKGYLNSFDRFVVCDNDEISIKQAINKIMREDNQYRPATQLDPKKIASELIQMLEAKK